MPRIKSSTRSYPRAELIAQLAAELHREEGAGQPTIFEQEVAQTGRLHVIVVWDRWREVPPVDRSGLILEAYDEADPSASQRISIAMGVTVEEGMDLGVLSYSVALTRIRGDDATTAQLLEAMKEEGAVLTPQGWQLRYPTQAAADAAAQRLNERIPGGYGAVVRRGE